MHDLLTIFKRFIPPYKLKLTKSILFNFLHALFGSLAIAMLMPVLGIIFDNQKDVHELVPYALTKEAVSNNFYYYITQIKHAFGPSTTLIFVGLLAVIATALKPDLLIWQPTN